MNTRQVRANDSIERAPPSEGAAGLPEFLRQYTPLLNSYERELATLEPPGEQSIEHGEMAQAVSDLADLFRDMQQSLDSDGAPVAMLPRLELALSLQRTIVDRCKVLESEADPATDLNCTDLFEASFEGPN